MRFLFNAISAVFHPLLMPTYGIILTIFYTYLWMLPNKMKFLVVFLVFSLTCLFPALLILLMMRFGKIKDAELTNRKERSIPYLIFIAALVFTCFLLYRISFPLWVISIFLAVCVALLCAVVINFYWKISVHALGIGSLLGGVMAFAKIAHVNYYGAFISLFIIAGAVCSSRIYLGRHTPMQVLAGFLLGVVSAFSIGFIRQSIIF